MLKIRMSIKEGLTFQILEVLKNMRATYKGEVTHSYKLVRNALVRTRMRNLYSMISIELRWRRYTQL